MPTLCLVLVKAQRSDKVINSKVNRLSYILIMSLMGIFFFSCKNDMAVIQEMTGQFNNDSNHVVIEENLKLEIFNASESKIAELTSKRGLYLENSARMEAIDSVVFSNIQGETLTTEKLIWLQDSAIIFSNDPVTIYREQGVIYGDGIVSNESFTKYSITKPRGELEVKQLNTNEPE